MGVGYPFTLPSVQLCGSAWPGSQRTQIPPSCPEKGPTLTAGPVPGSQICQHDSALPRSRPESLSCFLPGASLVRCLLDGATVTLARRAHVSDACFFGTWFS